MKTPLSLTLLGILVGALGVFVPIGWDLWNSRSEVSLEVHQTTTILQKEDSIQKLEIFYGGKPINALSKTVLILSNSGRTPISKADVISPPTIHVGDAELLEVTLSRESPPNLAAEVTVFKSTVSVTFQLLNPGDEIELQVLTAERSPVFTADSRIKNVREIAMQMENQKKAWWQVGPEPYIAGVFGAFFFLLSLVALSTAHDLWKAQKAVRKPDDFFNKVRNKKDVESFVKPFLTTSILAYDNRDALRDLIANLEVSLTEADKQRITTTLKKHINNEALIPTGAFTLILGGIGIWYAIASFLSLY